MLVDLVPVAAGGVRLPDLDERAADRPAVLVEHAAGDDDPLAERLAVVLPRQVVVELARARPRRRRARRARAAPPAASRAAGPARASASSGSRDSRPEPRGRRSGSSGRTIGVSSVGHQLPFVSRLRSASSSPRVGGSVSRRRRRRAAPSRSPRAPRRPRRRDARRRASSSPSRGSRMPRSVTTTRTRSPTARREVELLDERARRLPQHHEDVAHAGRDLGRAAAAGQPHLRRVVVADHGAVEVAVAVDLRGAEEADVDAAALEPVREHLRHRDDRVGGLGELAVADRERQRRRLGADRAALVDEHAVRGVRAAREVRGEARQADADEADRAVVEPPRRLDRHHLVGVRRPRSRGRPSPPRGSRGTRRRRPCRARAAASRP